jgi:flagellin-like hook-associated protein FlgL
MSNIVLSSAVRQNLLALQNTASLMATTQNDLATGKKVNSALDNPTNFFTAAGLDNRASDISNLLDGISNGVQVLQAANTGITSLESLVSQAKSIADQALQTSIGYSTKSSFTSGAIAGATASNLLGTATYSSANVTGGTIANDDSSATTTTANTSLAASTSTDSIAGTIADGDTLTINGATITFSSSASTATSATGGTINIASGKISDVISAIDAVTGGTASVASGKLVIGTGTTSDLTIGGTAGVLTALGLTAATTARTSTTPLASGSTLTIAATGGGTATAITFGTSGSQISTLDQLNTALAANNLAATINATTGALTISTTNDAASSTIGNVSGSASTGSAVFHSNAGAQTAPVADAASQTTRATLVSQYNAILTQIDNTAADSSYNGVNLLNGDQLQLTFNETGKSTLSITGVQDSSAGLGLTALSATNFADNSATNKVLTTLTTVSNTLRSQASAFGSNLSVVQTRQDFNTNLINVLQTGSANLTQADINLEAANSQALQTRQSLSVSALSLANQAQQSVLQLLR